MNPATSAPHMSALPSDARKRRQRRLIWVAVGGAALMLIAGVLGGLFVMTGWIKGMAREPWAQLQQVAVATRTDAGAATFYEQNPALAAHFTTAPAFVAATRQWRAKLAALPGETPDLWQLLRQGASLNVRKSGSQVTLDLTGYEGADFHVVTQHGRLLDVAIR